MSELEQFGNGVFLGLIIGTLLVLTLPKIYRLIKSGLESWLYGHLVKYRTKLLEDVKKYYVSKEEFESYISKK